MISSIAPQLRTIDLDSTIRFYTDKLGFEFVFRYEDLYAAIRIGSHVIHLKYACEPDPSIAYVNEEGHLHLYFETQGIADLAEKLKENGVVLVNDVHETPWQTREIVVNDDQGHTLYFGEPA
ncbi:MAG TPA: VOC family protein [Pyrinomonadaceae bacterium]|nr:VOC family protein [Pyrinomonadaceae bacterium]